MKDKTKQNQSSPTKVTTETPSTQKDGQESPNFLQQITSFLMSWKFKVMVGAIAVFLIFWTVFSWKHIIAMQSLNRWANNAQADAIDCMMQDSNKDKYISCSAKLDNQIVPLECGTSIFNMGCRVNYGSASPSVKLPEN